MISAPRSQEGWTLVELVIVVAIISLLASTGAVQLGNVRRAVNGTKVEQDIREIMRGIESYHLQFGTYPDSLDDVPGIPTLDPWGEPFEYVNHANVRGNGKVRKDRNLVPINSQYDLWSKGPDRLTKFPLTAQHSRDDYIMANDGRYVGPVSGY